MYDRRVELFDLLLALLGQSNTQRITEIIISIHYGEGHGWHLHVRI